MKKLLYIQRIHETGIAIARQRTDVEVEVTTDVTPAGLAAAVAGAHGIVVRTAVIDAAVIAAAPDLEVVSRHGVGYDAVDVATLTARGIPLTITPRGNAVSVAEHTMFMLLALAKQCRVNELAVREGRFEEARTSMRAIDLAGKTLLLIGFGRTGSRVAPLARAFGMDVIACDPYIDQGIIAAAGCTPVADFRTVLPDVDAISVHVPLNAETRAMIGPGEFRAVRPDAFVVNVARGGIVDEAALVAVLERRGIAGAGLDVFDGEPAPPPVDHPLFAFDNVIVSPHCAGVTLEASIRTSEFATRNALDAFDGTLDPEVVVNPEVLGAQPTRTNGESQ